MSDIISRQDAINFLLGILGKIDDEGYGWIPRRAAVEGIANLPSTMPAVKVVRCKECKHNPAADDNCPLPVQCIVPEGYCHLGREKE